MLQNPHSEGVICRILTLKELGGGFRLGAEFCGRFREDKANSLRGLWDRTQFKSNYALWADNYAQNEQ